MSKVRAFLVRKNYQLLEWFRRRFDAPSDADWSWVIDQIFNKIAWLERDGETKKEISIAVVDGVKITKIYWLEIILSSLIATFGLIQNSVAVIIGAMLIAPLLRPIQAMAFAMANGRSGLFWKCFKILFLSFALGIFIAFLVSRFLPFVTENSEILARTSPNLIDLLVAVSSAMIALLAFAYKRLYASVAGVAMATALMPPIAVIGIEIFLGNFTEAWGGFLLFFTNLSSILIVGAFMFIFYGFNPHEENTKRTVRSLFVLGTILIVLWMTLSSSLNQIRENIDRETVLKSIFDKEIAMLLPEAELNKFNVIGTDKSAQLKILGEIKLPEDVALYNGVLERLGELVSLKFEKSVQLDLDIIRTAKIQSQKVELSLEQKIGNESREVFEANFPDVLIIKQEVLKLSGNDWSVKTVYTLPNGVFMDDWMQEKIEVTIQTEFITEKIGFVWGDISQREDPKIQQEPTADELWFSEFQQRWDQFFQDNLPEGVLVDNLVIKWKKDEAETKSAFLYFDLQVPKNYDLPVLKLFEKNLAFYQNSFEAISVEVMPRIFEYSVTFPELLDTSVLVEEAETVEPISEESEAEEEKEVALVE